MPDRKTEKFSFQIFNLGVGNLVEIENASIQRSKCDTKSLERSRRLSAQNFWKVVE